MPELTANTHTELFLKAIAEGSTTPEGLVPENHLELWLQQIMEMGGVSGNYVRYTEQELSAAEEAQARDNIGAAGMEDLAPAYDSTTPYKVGNLLTYLGKQYYCIADAPAGTLPTNTTYFEEKSVADIIEMIKNGSIVTGHSEVADNLTPYSEDSGTTQENPFISQGTGTDNNSVIVTTGVIARQLEKQGNTIPFSQYNNVVSNYSENGITFTSTADGKVKIYGTASANASYWMYNSKMNTIPDGRKLLIMFNSLPSGVKFAVNSSETSLNKMVVTKSSGSCGWKVANGTIVDYESYVYFVDITSWDSSIITDLTANPSHFSWYYNGSLAYDAGSLQNCNGRYLECGQGRQLWDEVWEQGGLTTGGSINPNETIRRTTTFIPVIPNKPVYQKCPASAGNGRVAFYDANKNCIYLDSQTGLPADSSFNAPSNAFFMRVTLGTSYGTTYNHDITYSLYYTPEQGGEGYDQYYPYVAPIRIDTGSETLKAFDKKLPSGVIERWTLEKDLSTVSFTYDSSYWSTSQKHRWVVTIAGIALPSSNDDVADIKCDTFVPRSLNEMHAVGFTGTGIGIATNGNLYVYNNSDTVAPTGNVQIRLATPTTEQGTPFSEYAPINDYSYMAWFDTDGNLVSIPQGCKLFYPVDYKGFVDDLVMYTNGDATALAKGEDITDTALNARGYYKMQVLLSPLTDAAGLTYDIEEAMKIGSLVSLTIRATNLGESSISSGDPLFTLASDLIPAGTIKAYANVAGSVVSCTISNMGSVSVDAAIAQNETVAIIITYAV